MIRTVARTARKTYRCGCGERILPTQRYLDQWASPDGDLGNDHWWHIRECSTCAERYGRGELLRGQS